ncbi:putative mitochondrial protein AtMg00310 [Silene latifolia]|uniref:putative mitochondrial protein AtMg00310 n=1 Tax=Silene latifolia TaxID=37657 RepID=UPI003D773F7E
MVSKFWWGSNGDKRKISWVAWHKLFRPKSLGGLGFRDFHKFNMALLGKQAWRLTTEPDCLLARVLRAKYYRGKAFMNAELGRNPSFTWKGIWESRTVVRKGGIRRIGNGQGTKVWSDPWLKGSNSKMVLSPRIAGREDIRVADLMRADGRMWDSSKIRAVITF